MSQPNHQHYRNPLRWGWYYVDDGSSPLTGLMTKKAAKAFIKSRQKISGSLYSYGVDIKKRTDTPGTWWKKRFTRPENSG